MFSMIRPSLGHTTQPFGNVIAGTPHAGEDYAYTDGRVTFPDVFAAAGGVVLFAGDSRGLSWPNIMYLNPDFDRTDNIDSSAGNYVMIRHPGGQLTGYGHLERCLVAAGDTVRAGQVIGVVGQTGNSRGKHLHFDYVPDPTRVHVAPYYGRADPAPLYVSLSLQSGTSTPLPEEENEDTVISIDAEQAEAIAQRAAQLVIDGLNGHLLIHPVQAESIVAATTTRTTENIDALNTGKLIDRQQADDIAQAAAKYSKVQ